MDDRIDRIIATMLQVCTDLKRELKDFGEGPDKLAFHECRKQTRDFQRSQAIFKESLVPSIQQTQDPKRWQEIEQSLSSIQNHVLSLIEYTAPVERPDHAARVFHQVKEKRTSFLKGLEECVSLGLAARDDCDIREGNVPETDKAGLDGALSHAMKSCWSHICKIHKCVILQPELCECERHISDLRLCRQESDEQVGADVIFHWGSRKGGSHILRMREARIRCQKSFTNEQTLPQRPRVQRPQRSAKIAQDILSATSTHTLAIARTLCKSLESQGALSITSDDAGYLVTTSTSVSSSTSEERFMTLESILAETPTRTLHSQRLKIAHAIASSHLRLHPTQWLGQRWRSRDIVFAVKDGIPLLEQPYLRRQCIRGGVESTNTALWDDVTSTLGILLLELCFNRTIASFARERQDVNESLALHEEIDLAKQWLRELSGRTDEDYDDAVRWCLRTPPRVREINNEWRQRLQDSVIKPLEKLCTNSGSTSLILDFDKAIWTLRGRFEGSLVICKIGDEDPMYQALGLEQAYCPDSILGELVRQGKDLIKAVYTASYIYSISRQTHIDVQAFRMDETYIHNEAGRFYDGISRQSSYQKVLGTFILSVTDPPSKAWLKAWDRFTACCRGDQPLMSELISTYFPLDQDVIARLFTGRDPAERKVSPINPERADMEIFRSSQYYFCAARLVKDRQLHDHPIDSNHHVRMPFTSIRRIGGGGSADVFRVVVHSGHYKGQDQELAMKVVTVGPKTPDEWRHTSWMMDQLQNHQCIMRAKASLRLYRQVLIFYEAAECDLYDYMTNNDPPPSISKRGMFNAIREIADALNYLHQGLSDKAAAMACLHKDMKAENILVTWRPDKSMRLKLADFGISTIVHQRSLPKGDSSNGPSKCTPREHKMHTELGEGLHNAAPEMCNKGLVDASADIWAFGTVLADYIVWLFSGKAGLEKFEGAKSARYEDHAYFCAMNQRYEASGSASRTPTTTEQPPFVLKPEIEDWFVSTIDHIRKDKSVSDLDGKILEDCWSLLKSRILVCDVTKRGKSEDILRWLGEIMEGAFTPLVDTGSDVPVQDSVPITTWSSKRERTLSCPSPIQKKIRYSNGSRVESQAG